VTLSGKSVFITGGKRMGGAIAQALARQGANVALAWNRSRAEADEAASTVRAAGRRALSIHADLSTAEGCDLAVAEVEQAFGRLDALIHLASVYRSIPFDELTPDAWDAQMAVDLRSTFLCARAAVPAMRKVGGGRIIAFADWVAASGRPRYPGYLPYYVAKAGVIALVEALALELSSDNILVNAIAPGPILPPDELTADERRAVEAATPLGRWGGTEEIVKAVLFLLETGFVTGDVIRVDGGRHLR
jgi:NAD(P)-dependent dehydrogenase (short-subunit alcohol dehydrogenase family)